MRKYKYKETGVEWLGQIPKHWRTSRLANIGTFDKGSGIPRSEVIDEGLHAILYGDIYTKYDIKTNELVNKISKEASLKATKIDKGDLLLTGSGETKEDIGKCIVYNGDKEAFAGGDIIIFKSIKHDSLFLSYVLNSSSSIYQKIISSKGDIIVHIYGSSLRDLMFALPPPPEQKAIADYLDKACHRIDKIIEIKEGQIVSIERYFDKKVTELLSFGTSKDIILKETNELWIKKIPSHWKLSKLKYELEVKDGTHETPSYEYIEEGNFPFVTSKDIVENEIDFSDTKFINPQFHSDYFRRSNPCKGDIIMPMIGTLGNCAIVKTNKEFSIKNVALFKTSESTKIVTNFLFYFLESDLNKEQFYLETKGGVQSFLSLKVLRNLQVILPPKEEQDLIVDQLDILNERIKRIKLNLNNQMTILKSYRKSLIHECVTGKKQVWEGDVENIK